jgi:hypothetical protein
MWLILRAVTRAVDMCPIKRLREVVLVGRVPRLEPAFTWSSSSTIAVNEDGASDAREISREPNPFTVPTKESEPLSMPKAALAVPSPQRPPKTATVQCADMVFSPLAPTLPLLLHLSRPHPGTLGPLFCARRRKLRTAPALPFVLARVAMASPGGGALKLGKRCASNTPADSRPARNCCAHVVGRPNDRGGGGSATSHKEDSEAERDEVQQCLLRPVTPNPTAYQHQHRAPRAAAILLFHR